MININIVVEDQTVDEFDIDSALKELGISRDYYRQLEEDECWGKISSIDSALFKLETEYNKKRKN
jgi:hypothetical protein